jgi:uncharacterized protein
MRNVASVGTMRNFTSAGLEGILRGYQRMISPFLPSACRYHPTCSEYMRQAIEIHGPVRGVWYGMKRLGRCHPFHAGGFDPVPHADGFDVPR